ncbi:MAG TPA: hypothetical protein VFH34_06765 [Anaerolineales bacterium]|nr:hypothetical protein [Anaerolineales bacterium]
METPEPVDSTAVRRRQVTILAVVAGIALCCACFAVGAALYSWSSLQGVQPQDFPEGESTPSGHENSLTPSFDPNSTVATQGPGEESGEPPTGGLGNDILRNDTWQAVAAAAEGQGCDQPIGADSTIEVLQEPDSAGVWVEQWTVACQSGDSYEFEVEYILDATGTTFNIRSLP